MWLKDWLRGFDSSLSLYKFDFGRQLQPIYCPHIAGAPPARPTPGMMPAAQQMAGVPVSILDTDLYKVYSLIPSVDQLDSPLRITVDYAASSLASLSSRAINI
jgi:hypothetical protein